MNAIEFQTTITDSFVQIPNYERLANKQVRIIILDNSPSSTKQKSQRFIDKYTHNPISLAKNIDFLTKDEAS